MALTATDEKKITELQLISAILPSQMFPLDNGIQTYRATISQLKTFLAPIYIPHAIQRFTSGSGTYYKTRAFIGTNMSATAGATYTHNSVTWTVLTTVASGTILYMYGNGDPLASGTLTKSGGTGDTSITFTEYRDPIALEVEMIGGGGGGGGGATSSASGGAGGNGGNTTFGSSLLTAGLGSGGPAHSTYEGGAGGSVTVSAPAIEIVKMIGTKGGAGSVTNSTYGALPSGAYGGSGPYGGGGCGASYASGSGSNRCDAVANSGSGGGSGNGNQASVDCKSGNGGGAGGYIKALIPSPSASYAYAVGAGGSAGAAGNGSSYAGGLGAAGFIMVKAIFQ